MTLTVVVFFFVKITILVFQLIEFFIDIVLIVIKILLHLNFVVARIVTVMPIWNCFNIIMYTAGCTK